jgi:hypothetical protein
VFERLTNGGFEQLRPDGTPYGWRDVGAELSVAAESPVDGRFALAVTSRTGSTKWAYQSVRVERGAWYEASAYARSVSADEIFIRLSWYTSLDGSGAALDSVDSTATAGPGAAGFSRLTTGPVHAPANALVVRVRLMLRPGSDGETVALFDAVALEAAQPDDTGPRGTAGAAASSERPHSVVAGGTSPQSLSAGAAAAAATPFRFANVHPEPAQAAAIAPTPGGGYKWLAGVGIAIGGAALVFAVATEVAARRRSEGEGDGRPGHNRQA